MRDAQKGRKSWLERLTSPPEAEDEQQPTDSEPARAAQQTAQHTTQQQPRAPWADDAAPEQQPRVPHGEEPAAREQEPTASSPWLADTNGSGQRWNDADPTPTSSYPAYSPAQPNAQPSAQPGAEFGADETTVMAAQAERPSASAVGAGPDRGVTTDRDEGGRRAAAFSAPAPAPWDDDHPTTSAAAAPAAVAPTAPARPAEPGDTSAADPVGPTGSSAQVARGERVALPGFDTVAVAPVPTAQPETTDPTPEASDRTSAASPSTRWEGTEASVTAPTGAAEDTSRAYPADQSTEGVWQPQDQPDAMPVAYGNAADDVQVPTAPEVPPGPSEEELLEEERRRHVTELQHRWLVTQAQILDDPRDAVREAGLLIGDALQYLTATFSSHRDRIERSWKDDSSMSTDELRDTMRRYRSLFQYVLSVTQIPDSK